MDPATLAALAAITAIANMITELVKSQPPDVQKAMWDRYNEHVTWIQSFLHPPAKP